MSKHATKPSPLAVATHRLAFSAPRRKADLPDENTPHVPAALKGRATPEEVQRWTTHLPLKPPGRGT